MLLFLVLNNNDSFVQRCISCFVSNVTNPRFLRAYESFVNDVTNIRIILCGAIIILAVVSLINICTFIYNTTVESDLVFSLSYFFELQVSRIFENNVSRIIVLVRFYFIPFLFDAVLFYSTYLYAICGTISDESFATCLGILCVLRIVVFFLNFVLSPGTFVRTASRLADVELERSFFIGRVETNIGCGLFQSRDTILGPFAFGSGIAALCTLFVVDEFSSRRIVLGACLDILRRGFDAVAFDNLISSSLYVFSLSGILAAIYVIGVCYTFVSINLFVAPFTNRRENCRRNYFV